MSLNRCTFVGRLVADPETKFLQDGTQVVNFRIAVNRFTKKADGSGYEADFFNVVAWRKTAEFVSNYVTKGRLVSVDGRAQQRSWVDRETNQNRSVVEFVADNVEALDKKDTDADGTKPTAAASAADGDTDPFADE